MLMQCPECGNYLGFVVAGAPYRCRCGAIITVELVTGDNTTTPFQALRDFMAKYPLSMKTDIPRAFYDAFTDEDVQP